MTPRQLATIIMPEFARVGMSAASVRSYITETLGYAYRWQDLLADYRSYTGFYRKEDVFTGYEPDEKVPFGAMTGMEFKNSADKYRWYADATYRNKLTGETWTHAISTYTNTDPYKLDWYSEWQEQFGEDERYQDWELDYVKMRGAEYNTRIFG